MEVTTLIAFFAGLVSFLSPCVLPLVPAYIGYMGGRVANTVASGYALEVNAAGGVAMQGGAQRLPGLGVRLSTFAHGIAFVLGFTFVFVTIGLIGTAFVTQVGRQNITLFTRVIAHFGGVLIIFFGFHFMGVIPALSRRLLASPRVIGSPLFSLAFAVAGIAILLWASVDILIALPLIAMFSIWLIVAGAFTQPIVFWTTTLNSLINRLYADTRRQIAARGGGLGGSTLMGIIFAAGWTPCIGPIYGSILTLGFSGMEIGRAGVLLAAYSLGLGIPFLLAALLLDGAKGMLRKLQRRIHTIEVISGVFLVVVGFAVASGRLQDLSQQFAVQFADLSYRMEECVSRIGEGELNAGQFFECASTADVEPGLPS